MYCKSTESEALKDGGGFWVWTGSTITFEKMPLSPSLYVRKIFSGRIRGEWTEIKNSGGEDS